MTYTELVDFIHQYTNRNSKVLPYSLVKGFINFSANNCFKKLRIPPLEAVTTYNASEFAGANIAVPDDAIEFIQLRKLGSDGEVDKIYNAKADIRSFYHDNMTKYDYYNYTREGNVLLVNPEVQVGDQFQLMYYQRLPSMDARYDVSYENSLAGNLYYEAASAAALVATVEAAEGDDVFTKDTTLATDVALVSGDPDLADGYYLGKLGANWLRDEDEKTVLYGALVEAYAYLNDDPKAMKYKQFFDDSINELNKEAVFRSVRGGISQAHYEAPLL